MSAHTNHDEAQLRSRRAAETVAASAAVEEPLGRLRVRRGGENNQEKEKEEKQKNNNQTTSHWARSILLAAGETG